MLLGVAVVWGSSYLAAKVVAADVGVLPLLALRYVGAALALAVLVALAHVRGRRLVGRTELRLGLVLGLSQAAVLALETYGVAATSATNAGLLIATTILLTPVVDGLVARRFLPPAFFGACLVALAGVALLVSGGGFRAPTAGDLLVLAAAVVRAGHVTALGRLTATAPVDLVGLTLVQSLVGAVLFTAADPFGVARTVATAGPAQWAGLAYLALACSVFAFLAQTWAVRRTSASRASLLLGTEPLWAVVVGVALAGEVLGTAGAAGAALLLLGTTLGQRVEADVRSRDRPAPAGAPEPLGSVPVPPR